MPLPGPKRRESLPGQGNYRIKKGQQGNNSHKVVDAADYTVCVVYISNYS
jgi:hypothetical protein